MIECIHFKPSTVLTPPLIGAPLVAACDNIIDSYYFSFKSICIGRYYNFSTNSAWAWNCNIKTRGTKSSGFSEYWNTSQKGNQRESNSYLFQAFVCWWLVEYSLPSFLYARCATDHHLMHAQHTNSAKCMKMSRYIRRVVQSSWRLDYLYTALLNGLILLIAWFNNLIHRPSAAISSALGFKYKSLMSAIYKKEWRFCQFPLYINVPATCVPSNIM